MRNEFYHSFDVLQWTINCIIYAIIIEHWRIHVAGSIIIIITWSKHFVHGLLNAAWRFDIILMTTTLFLCNSNEPNP